ncbi:MAG: PGPGW domain-containing protein [Gammaproteobacteria bacterium]
MLRALVDLTVRQARRLIVAVVGTTVLLFGIALVFLPGPAFVVIPIGLGILGLEFAWARRLLKRVRKTISDQARNVRMRRFEGETT